MDFCKLDNLIDALPSRGFPAVDFAVTLKGELVYRRSVGYSDFEQTKPVSPTDLYQLYSISKVTTCVAAMRLVEEGKIALDDPVSKYLPAYADLTVRQADGTVAPAKNPMTILHLFTMTGGMDYDLHSKPLQEARDRNPHITTLEAVNAMAKNPLFFEPGTHYRYSLCHDVLAAVVEVAGGMRFADYVQKTILDPLGMKDSGYHISEQDRPRLTAAYRHVGALMRAVPDREPAPYGCSFILSDRYDSGGAGMHGTLDDQLTLMTTLANGGTAKNGYRLLKPETVAMMQVGRLAESARPDFGTSRLIGYDWGLCGRVLVHPEFADVKSSIGEFGWDGAANSFSLADPAAGVALFFATEVASSAYGYHYVHPKLRDLTYEALKQ